MTDNLELVWVQNLRSFIRGQVGFVDEWLDIFVERLDATIADNARLQEALAAAEIRIVAKDEALRALIDGVQEWVNAVDSDPSWDGWDHHYKYYGHTGLDAPRAALAMPANAASLPALLAETRKKALEEAAQIAENTVDFHDDGLSTFDAAQIIAAAIRSLSADEAQP